jgi:hypothetical protein
MFACGGGRDFVHVMGLDRKAFHTLLVPFTGFYNKYNVEGVRIVSKFCSHGKRALSPSGIGLALHWLCSTSEKKYLCYLLQEPKNV